MYTFTMKFKDEPKFEATVSEWTVLGALAKAMDYCQLKGYSIKRLVSVQSADGSYIID